MAIKNELSASVDPLLVQGVQRNVLTSDPFAAITIRQARTRSGVARDGVALTQLTRYPNGSYYRGSDEASATAAKGLTKHYQAWSNYKVDRVIEGTDLEETAGGTTASLIMNDQSSLAQLPDGGEGIIDIVSLRTTQASVAMWEDIGSVMHGTLLPTDTVDRMPVTGDQIFDQTASLHGLAPAELGTFADLHSRHPWKTAAPGDSASVNLHEPRYWNIDGAITKAKIEEAATAMGAAVSGFWICPCHPTNYENLVTDATSTTNATVQIPMGIGQYVSNIEAVQIGRALIFVSARAALTSMRFFHIGNPGAKDGAYFHMFWNSPGSQSNSVPDAPAISINNLRQVNLGSPGEIPMYVDEWDRDSRFADAVNSPLRVKMATLCTERWKMWELRGLVA